MSSEAITRNDLKAVLNEVLPHTSVASNVWIGNNSVGASTTVSYDVGYDIISTNYTTNTGHFIAIGIVPMKTSRYTSRAVVKINGVVKGLAGTNKTTITTIAPVAEYKGVKGETYNVALAIGSQDTGTTASTESYNHVTFIIFDINDSNNGLAPMEDYIVEQGTDGIWTYRKWASGIAECWGGKAITLSNYATTAGLYAYYTYMEFPSGFFVSAPVLTYSAYIDNAYALTGTLTTALTKDGLNLYALSNVSGSKLTSWYVDAKGRWK